MANINGNNIDDLFRQASDQYPLRTDSSDWNKLAAALEADPSLIPHQGSEQKEKRRRKRFLWIFLPLLAGGVGYYVWHGPATQKGISKLEQPVSSSPGSNNIPTDQFERTSAKDMPAETAPEQTKEAAVVNIRTDKSNASGRATGSEAKGNTKVIPVFKAGGETRDIPETRGAMANRAKGGAATTGRAKASRGNRDLGGNRNLTGNRNVTGNHNLTGNRSLAANPDLAGNYSLDANSDQAGNRDLAGIPQKDAQYSKVNTPGYLAKGDIAVNVDVRAKKEMTAGQTEQQGAKPAPLKKKTPVPHKHAIYLGILGAPDLSTIHFQSVKSVGTTFGILAGYTFNSKWSLETGVYLDKKRYFTDGGYFSKEKVPALRYSDLRSVNGSCNMVELPVNMRYSLSSGNHYKLFATAGLSTYLMSKEWYAYQLWAGGGGTTNKSFTYTNPYHYLFSIVNLSFGYEQKLGKIGDLRVEPYLRIPLSGIGTGNLSILSAGLNLGITRRIW